MGTIDAGAAARRTPSYGRTRTPLPTTPMTVFTFDTTHHALWAEEVARERGIPAEVIPAPPAANAKCNLALETLPEELDALRAALAEEGVPFRLYEPGE